MGSRLCHRAAVAAWFRYGVREEAVPGGQVRRHCSGSRCFWCLPVSLFRNCRPPRTVPAPRVAILDISASMELPLAARRTDPNRLRPGAVRRLAPGSSVRFRIVCKGTVGPGGAREARSRGLNDRGADSRPRSDPLAPREPTVSSWSRMASWRTGKNRGGKPGGSDFGCASFESGRP